MIKTNTFPLGGLLACLFSFLLAGAFAQPSDNISIQGVLQDSQGRALTGSRAWRIRFYTDSTGNTQIGSNLTGNTLLSDEGRFSFLIVPPVAAYSAVDLHYDLAVDSDTPPNGIGAGDLFPGLVRVASVPFARLSQNSNQLGGLPASSYGLASGDAYTVIVDDDGPAHFSTVQAAIASGARTVFVRNGNYTLSSIVTIPSAPFTMIGESRDGVRINLAYAGVIVYAGDTGLPYREGTVNLSASGTTVEAQSGAPLWLANAQAGDIIRIEQSYHRIASVNSNTNITISPANPGKTFSGSNYSVATYGTGFHFENLTFLNPRNNGSLGQQEFNYGAICLRYAREITVNNCRALITTAGGMGQLVALENSHYATITNCHVERAGLINAFSCSSITVHGNSLLNSEAFQGLIAAFTVNGDDPQFGIVITSNRISGGAVGVDSSAIFVGHLSGGAGLTPPRGDFIIANNFVTNFRGTDPSTNSSSAVVKIFNANAGAGVISGNIIRNSFANGINLVGSNFDSISITGNVITGNSGFAIRTNGSNHANILVTNNAMEGNALGGANMAGIVYSTLNVPKFEQPVP